VKERIKVLPALLRQATKELEITSVAESLQTGMIAISITFNNKSSK